jgi:hypothetical protein
MKTFVRYTVVLLAIAVACQAGLALAEDYYWTNGSNQPAATPAAVEKAAPAAQPQSACDPCCPAGLACEQPCGTCDPCRCRLGCEGECDSVGIVGFQGLDSFKGIADGSYQSNFGEVTGVNIGTGMWGLEQYGFGWQTGLSYGVYDWDGRTSTINNPARAQQQLFVTTGFFRKATKCDQRVSFGLVYDWMYNEGWGEYGAHPTLGQWRGQIEYAFSGHNSTGLFACKRDLSAQQTFDGGLAPVTVTNRAISQIDLFWHHKFCSGADSYLWIGLPDHGRLDGGGSLLDWIIGANVQVPLTESLALYANGAYFHPSASASAGGAMESGYNVGMGIAWYFGGGARNHAINGRCGDPYMPVANNSNFLVDQNPAF